MKVYKYRGDKEYFSRDIDTLKRNQIYAPTFEELMKIDNKEGEFNDQATSFLDLIGEIFKKDVTEVKKAFRDIAELKSKLGIYSLGKSYKNDHLWKFYSNNYRGFCIEYDFDILENKYLGSSHQEVVNYTINPPVISMENISSLLMQKLFATKRSVWENEDEIRLIYDTSGLKDYHPNALTGIYFGIHCLENHKEELISSLEGYDVIFYQMRLDKNTNQLNKEIVHECRRNLRYKLDEKSFKVLQKNDLSILEKFYVHYKPDKKDDKTLHLFFQGFNEKYATKKCEIHLFDDPSIESLIGRNELNDEQRIRYGDSCFAIYYSESQEISFYPFKDWEYEDCKKRLTHSN